MKVKRCKRAKRILLFYRSNFGYREPFQIIIDGTFCQAALKGRINLKEQLPKYFSSKVQLLTTKCILAELASHKTLNGAHFIAKRLQVRNCHHSKAQLPNECINSLLGSSNSDHYFIATQDSEMRHTIQKRGSIPLLHIIGNTIVLESPSESSKEEVDNMTFNKVEVCTSHTLPVTNNDHNELRNKKRKRPKGPNPLSVKKKAKPRGLKVSSLLVKKTRRKRTNTRTKNNA